MKPSEIRDLKKEEIEAKLADAREALMNLRFRQVSGQVTDTSQMRVLRRDIARMMTILGERLVVVEGEA
jgi:large subunit ribosomal protein L29